MIALTGSEAKLLSRLLNTARVEVRTPSGRNRNAVVNAIDRADMILKRARRRDARALERTARSTIPTAWAPRVIVSIDGIGDVELMD